MVIRLLHTAKAEEPLGLHLGPSSSLAGGPFLLSFFLPVVDHDWERIRDVRDIC